MLLSVDIEKLQLTQFWCVVGKQGNKEMIWCCTTCAFVWLATPLSVKQAVGAGLGLWGWAVGLVCGCWAVAVGGCCGCGWVLWLSVWVWAKFLINKSDNNQETDDDVCVWWWPYTHSCFGSSATMLLFDFEMTMRFLVHDIVKWSKETSAWQDQLGASDRAHQAIILEPFRKLSSDKIWSSAKKILNLRICSILTYIHNVLRFFVIYVITWLVGDIVHTYTHDIGTKDKGTKDKDWDLASNLTISKQLGWILFTH